ncbi:hypothetical protein ASG01_08645 [Chryseobacterium sp. Leaf180]|uniref:hypothetical protein n=1 Tax=Chryseobacterium sp. Leaf180 TaxID=1736289 RepID=UPI0006F89EF7|nr:hypothetical protein [Chryseobacterium sp. Leaf180]KQR93256.1 hypothetical protein ASG01_08645 [Chryseobacterium sp. Leaf180]
MRFGKNTPVKIKSFLGTLKSVEKVEDRENYWKLIGEKGKVIGQTEIIDGRVLVIFDKNLNEFGVENHNPVKNSLWIKMSDLELDDLS